MIFEGGVEYSEEEQKHVQTFKDYLVKENLTLEYEYALLLSF